MIVIDLRLAETGERTNETMAEATSHYRYYFPRSFEKDRHPIVSDCPSASASVHPIVSDCLSASASVSTSFRPTRLITAFFSSSTT